MASVLIMTNVVRRGLAPPISEEVSLICFPAKVQKMTIILNILTK